MTNPSPTIALGASVPSHSALHLGRSGDGVVYVSASGSDSNGGFTWGTAKATIAAAFAALPGRSGTIMLGAGTFALSATVYLTSDGTATGTPAKVRLIGAGTDQTIITYSGTGDAISTGTSGSVPGGAFVARDLAINGAGSGSNSRGLYLKRYQQATALENVKITGFGFANLHAYRCYGISMTACHFNGGGGWGALLDNSNGFVAVATRFSSNTDGGARVFFNDGTSPFDEAGAAMAAGTFLGCLVEDNAGPGISIESASGIDVIGGYIEGNAGATLGQIVVTGASAGTVSYARIAGVRFNAIGASRTAARAIYCDYGEVHTEGNNSFNHTTAFLEVTANGTVHWGAGHRDGTRPEGSNLDAKVLIDTSRQSQNVRLSTFADGETVTIAYKLTTPAASVTNGDVPISNSALGTPRMVPPGNWECESILVRSTVAPTAGQIEFFPKSGTTSLSAALDALLGTGTSFVGVQGNARSAVSGGAIGLGYTTSGAYVAAAAEYTIMATFRLQAYRT